MKYTLFEVVKSIVFKNYTPRFSGTIRAKTFDVRCIEFFLNISQLSSLLTLRVGEKIMKNNFQIKDTCFIKHY